MADSKLTAKARVIHPHAWVEFDGAQFVLCMPNGKGGYRSTGLGLTRSIATAALNREVDAARTR